VLLTQENKADVERSCKADVEQGDHYQNPGEYRVSSNVAKSAGKGTPKRLVGPSAGIGGVIADRSFETPENHVRGDEKKGVHGKGQGEAARGDEEPSEGSTGDEGTPFQGLYNTLPRGELASGQKLWGQRRLGWHMERIGDSEESRDEDQQPEVNLVEQENASHPTDHENNSTDLADERHSEGPEAVSGSATCEKKNGARDGPHSQDERGLLCGTKLTRGPGQADEPNLVSEQGGAESARVAQEYAVV
jgi:hypothetical protein